MLTAKEIRESFKEFFRSKGHHIVPSAPMVIKDDPTLMFTNAGMNQFKDIILGNKAAKYQRVADSQKCLRVSGKHNDLEEVGMDTYHHTMFEMLGNWSFGDYFKQEAIDWAWEYLVDVLELDPARLYATVFEGAPDEGLSRATTRLPDIGKSISPHPTSSTATNTTTSGKWATQAPAVPARKSTSTSAAMKNAAQTDGASLVNKDNPRGDRNLEPRVHAVQPQGRWFSRIAPGQGDRHRHGLRASLHGLQGKKSNYDTDVFTPLISRIAQLSARNTAKTSKVDVAMRVIADHVRTIAFSIADSQLPGNAKAGYVIRRILRRAVRYAYTFLDQKQAFMYKLVNTLIDSIWAKLIPKSLHSANSS